MSRALTALSKATEKFEIAHSNCDWTANTCYEIGYEFDQDDFNSEVDFQGSTPKAKKKLVSDCKTSFKATAKDLQALIKASTALLEALPGVVEEKLAALEEFEYTDEVEDDTDPGRPYPDEV